MDEINILGIDYELEYVDVIDKNERLIGQIDYTNQVIKIENGMNKQRIIVTIIHEVLHGILYQLGFEEQHDEKLIHSLSTSLYQVLRENQSFLIEVKE